MVRTRKGIPYLRAALNLTLGAGAVLGGSYIISRMKEKQDGEASLARLEQMVNELVEKTKKE